ncbi:MAG: ABC transporter ATP-binding protein [Acidimicrobiales bacterium]
MAVSAPPPAPPSASPNAAAHSIGATKIYGSGETAVHALRGVTVAFERGDFTAIMGPSGSGKSTLMQCMAGLDRLTGGETFVGDVALSSLNDKALTELRRDRIGFIFQAFNLIPTLNALENIRLPLDLAGRKVDRDWLDQVVSATRLGDRLDHRPNELSGGQQQRVAVARALASRPAIIFGDEPTGNLDSATSSEILEFMREAVDNLGQTIVMVTHDPHTASYADHVLFLNDGQIVDRMDGPTPDRVFDRIKSLGG